MATGWLITQRSRIRILSSLPAETRPEGFAPGGCHAAREHGSTCQLSAPPHGAAARTTVCMFGSLKPSDRSSELRSFGLSEADHSGSLSGSRPMQQRLVYVEAGQRSPFSARKCLRRRSAAFTAASHAEGHWFEPSRDHHVKRSSEDGFEAIDQPSGPRRAFYRAKFQNRSTAR